MPGSPVGYLEDRGPTDGHARIVRRTEHGWEVNRMAARLVRPMQTERAEQVSQGSGHCVYWHRCRAFPTLGASRNRGPVVACYAGLMQFATG